MPSTKLGFKMILVGLSLANLPLLAQTPAACLSQVVPIKPSNLFCSNAAPVCATDQSGVRGRWVWGCPNPASSSPAPSGPDWTKLLPQPPPAESASDVALKAAQAREMRQQTELMRQQTEVLRQQNEKQPETTATASQTTTKGMLNGFGWQKSNPDQKIYYVGAVGDVVKNMDLGIHFGLKLEEIANLVDGFYIDPANIMVPVVDALRIMSFQRTGASMSEVDQMRRKLEESHQGK